jgi:hypothetical protein
MLCEDRTEGVEVPGRGVAACTGEADLSEGEAAAESSVL